MAGQVTLAGSVAYDDGVKAGSLSVVGRLLTSAGKRFTESIQNVATSEQAVNLGGITAPGALILINLDATNYIDVKVATSGAIFCRLLPDTLGNGSGGFCVIDRMGTGAQAPFVIANTASCRMACLVVDA